MVNRTTGMNMLQNLSRSYNNSKLGGKVINPKQESDMI